MLTSEGLSRFPLRRLGRHSTGSGFGHRIFHHLAWHALWRFSLGSVVVWIVVLAVVAVVVRAIVRRRAGRSWYGKSERF
ncbi:hypothetical protein KGA66_16960 [Actinocrinis puniceicyclus]|uniref:Uncharacterized protein n=1 Tax=Actinocrinis puniceicyclus TaxID=977794 RepID=A0A8J7WLU0_9ACTN|nr:hypothetical protein [Actinocrinis puniceicyclus]MBS2964751.1 hypothetical protein [Actinocrinis puniceicyclus]